MAWYDFMNSKYRKISNLDKNGNIKEIIKLVEKCEDDSSYSNYIFDKYDLTIPAFISIFDKDGKFLYDNKIARHKIIFNQELKKLMFRIDPDWESHFSDIEKEYILYSIKNPIYDSLLQSYGIVDFDEFFKKYFNGKGLTKAYYDDVFTSGMFVDSKILNKDPHFMDNYNELELAFLKLPEFKRVLYSDFLCIKNKVNGTIHTREDLPKYFDGKDFTKAFYDEIIVYDIIYDDLDEKIPSAYNKYYSNFEISFILFLHENPELKDIIIKYSINRENLSKYFCLKNNKIMIIDEFFRILFKELEWTYLIDCVDKVNLNELGLSNTEIILFKFYLNSPNNEYRRALLEILKTNPEILKFDEQQIDRFTSILQLLCKKLEVTNSPEMAKFKGDILLQIMFSENPEKQLDLIDEIYSRNNLPDVGKAYLVFKLLHPDYSAFYLDVLSNASPVLKSIDKDEDRDKIIYSDLIKCVVRSNNRSFMNYLLNIKNGNEIFEELSINSDKVLSEKELETLKMFTAHLFAMYNNTEAGKSNPLVTIGDIKRDLEILIPIFSNTRHSLPDRIVRMFCYYAGFKSFDELYKYMEESLVKVDIKNRMTAKRIAEDGASLKEGDFIKGLGEDGLKYFSTILQNGSVAKEFLCIGATSDSTPLDTDLSKIMNAGKNVKEAINSTISANYGPIWFVLKNDGRFNITREGNGDKPIIDDSKLELFQTLNESHYGIRTGFPSTEIDYIVLDTINNPSLIPIIKHLITLNGFYIPVVDIKNGKLIFDSKEFDELRKRMKGLPYYKTGEYIFSDNLKVNPEINNIIDEIGIYEEDALKKKDKINAVVKKVLEDNGLKFIDKFDYDITTGSAQLIDTGSTGRNTSSGKSSDFDFILRLDSNVSAIVIRNQLMDAFGGKAEDMSNLRIKGANIPGLDEPIDIDISFVRKSESNIYSTDNALKDRLDQIKEQDVGKYKEVIANIIYAKKFLKDNKVYKPSHSRDANEGGLGGVGVENWILQHGGSFYDAAFSFYEASKGKSFDDFKKEYQVWDYGLNYYTNMYDEFISGNMTEAGYKKMVEAIRKYIEKNKIASKTTYQSIEEVNINQEIIEDVEEKGKSR